MKECCEKWPTLKTIVTDVGGYFGEIKFCPECGSRLDDKPELLEEMPVLNTDDTLYRVFAKEINKIIRYLKAREK